MGNKYLFFLIITHSFIFNHIQAQDQINKLITGAILVRLETNEHLIQLNKIYKTINQKTGEGEKDYVNFAKDPDNSTFYKGANSLDKMNIAFKGRMSGLWKRSGSKLTLFGDDKSGLGAIVLSK